MENMGSADSTDIVVCTLALLISTESDVIAISMYGCAGAWRGQQWGGVTACCQDNGDPLLSQLHVVRLVSKINVCFLYFTAVFHT